MGLLSIASLNTNGFGIDRINYISELTKVNDIVFIQEHWQLHNQLHVLTSGSLAELNCHAVSGINQEKLLTGRPYGGCAILWKNTFNGIITPVTFTSNRVCGIILRINSSNTHILLCNVYMPIDTKCDQVNRTEYNSILHEIFTVSRKSHIDNILIGGDLNTDFSRDNSLHTKDLIEYMHEHTMTSWLNTGKSCNIDYTCENRSNHARSVIDHFILSSNLVHMMSSGMVKHSGDNLSDHSAIEIKLSCDTNLTKDLPKKTTQSNKPQWRAACNEDIENYKLELDTMLDEYQLPYSLLTCNNLKCSDENHIKDINSLTMSIVNACCTAAEHTLPSNNNAHKKSKSVPGWSETVEPMRQTSLLWHFIWKQSGSPHNGLIANIRRSTRANYHRAIRHVKRLEINIKSTRLGEAYNDRDSDKFWKYVRQSVNPPKPIPSMIDGENDMNQIASTFANKYSDLFNSVSFDSADMSHLLDDVHGLIDKKCCNNMCGSVHHISVNDIVNAVKKLKRFKHDGNTNCYSDNIINGTHKLYVHMSLLYTSMLVHGHADSHLLLSTIIPIVKDNTMSKSDSSNYRGISLASIMGKLLDIIIIESQTDALITSDLQFGFKSESSTSQCTFVVNEVIQYYKNNASNIFCVLLDASKAFDRVEFIKMFRLLLDKGICPTVARLLAYLYTSQKSRCKWGNSVSPQFSVSNGVKQGGVLSPHLFNVYIDVLLNRVKESNVGCYMGHMFMGCFGYADDVILLCPSVQAVDKMLEVCDQFSCDFNVKFNAGKSKLIVYSKENITVEFCFQGTTIPQSTTEKHLGYFIGADKGVSVKNITKQCHEMYAKVNLLMKEFRYADIDVRYNLFKSYCMSVYGCVLWNYESSEVELFFVAWRKSVRKLLNVPYNTHCDLLPTLCNDKSIEVQLHTRVLNFLFKMSRSVNNCVKTALYHVLEGSQSAVSNSLSFLCHKYNMIRQQCIITKPCIEYVPTEENRRLALCILDFIALKQESNDADIDIIINQLCTM